MSTPADNTAVRRPVERYLNSEGRAYATAIEAIDSDLIGALLEGHNRLTTIRARAGLAPAAELHAPTTALVRVATLIAERRAAS